MSRALAATVSFVVVAAVAGHWLSATVAGSGDFVEYGAACRLLLDGRNPYDPQLLLPLQVEAGWGIGWDTGGEPLRADMMWNPPWAFPAVLPFGSLPWGPGFAAWTAAQAAAVAWAAALAWRMYDGPPRLTWVAVAVGFAFTPTLAVLRVGQISGFLLLGLTGFAAAWRAGWPMVAGLCAVLTAIKPHLFFPFAVLLACDALRSRAVRVAVAVGGSVLVVAAIVPLAWNADVWNQYFAAVRAPGDEFHYAPGEWAPPTLSYRLREVLGAPTWVQFLPSVVTTAAMIGYWWVRRATWDWARELPAITLISVLTTGYGAWGFDLVVLLLPVVQAAAWLVRDSRAQAKTYGLGLYLAGNAALMCLLVPPVGWAPTIAAGYLAAAFLARPTPPFSHTDPIPASPESARTPDESDRAHPSI